jgi:Arc/MetJ-type ribon-helix-helix transcriptional regulator
MEKVMVSITKEMKDELEQERKTRFLDSIPETIRNILSEYLSTRVKPTAKDAVDSAAKEYYPKQKKNK